MILDRCDLRLVENRKIDLSNFNFNLLERWKNNYDTTTTKITILFDTLKRKYYIEKDGASLNSLLGTYLSLAQESEHVRGIDDVFIVI